MSADFAFGHLIEPPSEGYSEGYSCSACGPIVLGSTCPGLPVVLACAAARPDRSAS